MLNIILSIIIVILLFFLLKKKTQDIQQLIDYKQEVSLAKAQLLGVKEEYNSIITQKEQINKTVTSLALKW